MTPNPARPRRSITFGNLKGGVVKTTMSVHASLYYARKGWRVLLVDADPVNLGCMRWSEGCTDWPSSIVVVPWSGEDLARRVRDITADGSFDVLIIDTGPQGRNVLTQALLLCDELIVPVTPSPSEVTQVGDTFDLATEVDVMSPVIARVLLAKVRPGTNSPREARRFLDENEFPRMRSEIGLRETYITTWRTTVEHPEITAVFDELEEEYEETA